MDGDKDGDNEGEIDGETDAAWTILQSPVNSATVVSVKTTSPNSKIAKKPSSDALTVAILWGYIMSKTYCSPDCIR